jgi:hypothetical protein
VSRTTARHHRVYVFRDRLDTSRLTTGSSGVDNGAQWRRKASRFCPGLRAVGPQLDGRDLRRVARYQTLNAASQAAMPPFQHKVKPVHQPGFTKIKRHIVYMTIARVPADHWEDYYQERGNYREERIRARVECYQSTTRVPGALVRPLAGRSELPRGIHEERQEHGSEHRSGGAARALPGSTESLCS